jgi:hypothetical protein
MREPARSGCPINIAVEVFGDRWSLLVLRDVMFGRRRRFRELLVGSEETGWQHASTGTSFPEHRPESAAPTAAGQIPCSVGQIRCSVTVSSPTT